MGIATRKSHSWWFDSHKRPRQSLWLSAALSELDEKTSKMLKLIEEDADSFAQRAEMYYKKRPELVNMVEDFYRTHRSLAEQFDQLKLESRTRHTTPLGSPTGIWLSKLPYPVDTQSSSFSGSINCDDSEVDDPSEVESEVSSNQVKVESDVGDRMKEMADEIERLKEESRGLKAELLEKDEEKREVIRQLSMSVEILKEENSDLKKCLGDSKKKKNLFDFKRFNMGMLSARLFGGGGTTLVAL